MGEASWRMRQAGGCRRWVAALALGAVLSGALAGGAAWLAGSGATAVLAGDVESHVDAALGALRLADTASQLAGAVTQMETAPTAPRRQTAHTALQERVRQLSEGLDALLRGEAGRKRLDALRPPVMALENGVETLNQFVERRLTVERDLRAALERIPARDAAFRVALMSLPPGEARGRLEELGRSIAAQLLNAGTAPALAGDALSRLAAERALFRESADALTAALDALRIDPSSPRRADAARQLLALGVDSGNLFELRHEQARLAVAAGDAANELRERSAEIGTLARQGAQDLRDGVVASRDRALAGLAAGPVGVGLLTALAVFGAGAAAGRRLRRARSPAAPAPDGAKAETGEVPALNVLLAEDEPVNQMAAASMLRRAGHSVTVVGDGRAALAAVRNGRHDLVLMDLRMPEMDGAEAVRRIRALPDHRRACVPIVMLTASAVPDDPERCRAAGADAVLEKPLRLDRLEPVLERLFAAEAPAAGFPVEAGVGPDEPDADEPDADEDEFDADSIRQMREHLSDERVAALLAGTVGTLRQYHALLNEAWTDGDLAGVGAMAHKMAGVSGIYGCVALRRAAQALERAVETGEGDPGKWIGRLNAAFPSALARLEAQGASLAGV